MTTGTIKSIGQTIQVSDKFKKREFVLETTETHPQFILFELNQDKCDIIDVYHEGQKVSVEYNLRGRQWTNNQGEVKTFNTLQAWKIQPSV